MIEPHAPRPGIFYGWYIVAALIATGMTSTAASITLPRLAFPQMTQDLHASIAAISACSAITIGVGGLLAPFGGAIIDRVGARLLLILGVAALAVAVSLYPFVQSLWQLYALHVVFGVEASACSLLVPNILLSKWFVARRGAIIGLFLAGLTATGVLLPNLIAAIISSPTLGWRWAAGIFAIILWAVILPILWLVIREHPRDVGALPDGGLSTPESHAAATAKPVGLTFGQAIRTSVFWLLALGTVFLLTAVTAVITHLALYLTKDAGLPLKEAAAFTSLIAAADLCGKFGFGFFSDRFPKRRIALLTAALMFLASLALLRIDPATMRISAGLAEGTARMVAFSIVWGLAQGGLASIYMLLMPECFGQRELGRIMGSIMLIGHVGQSLGVWLMGYLRSATGDYTASFLLVICSTALGAICYVFIRPRQYWVDGPETAPLPATTDGLAAAAR
jgi:sugar phosphate permease